MRRKGFTLVELLVVISIIALLMAILMPALAQVRRLAQRIMCGTNLSAIGKAMIVYANDNEEEFPRAGGRNSRWATLGYITDWDHVQTGNENPEPGAFGATSLARATMSSNFFLLIKYTDGTPKLFNCKGDIGSSIFKLSDSTSATTPDDLTLVWDFGGNPTADGTKWPGEYVSYSYHMPFTHNNPNAGTQVSYPLSSSSSSASPLAADRNPYLDKNAEGYVDKDITGEQKKSSWSSSGFYDGDKVRNCAAHQREGQNVLYVDAHVEFERTPNCGIQNDYIWMCWQKPAAQMTQPDKEWGGPDYTSTLNHSRIGHSSLGPVTEEDAFLINEYNGQP
jgi:prepilin-type N-terminal cleavage/methylation domain-containing protein